MNIILFGDSHLARFGKHQIEELERRIKDATVYNCSTGGFNSLDGARRAATLGTLQPNIVIFSYIGNDVAPWKSGIPIDSYLHNMSKIFEAFPNSKKILFIPPDVSVERPDQTLEYNSRMHCYQERLLPVCLALNVTVIDGNRILASIRDDYHVSDGVHMNEGAYSKLIEALANSINAP